MTLSSSIICQVGLTQTMSMILHPIKWFYHEFGIVSIHETGRNAYFIILARTCRMFAYGTNSLILGMSCVPLLLPSLLFGLRLPPAGREVLRGFIPGR